MTITRTLKSLAAVALACLSSSCAGYRMGADKPTKMADVATLAIPVFKNQSLEPRSSVIVTNNVIKQFQNDATYKITDSASADAILKGTILRFERRQLRGVRTNVLKSRELEIRLWIEYTVEDSKTGAVLMKGAAQGNTSVFLDAKFQNTERQAIDEASRKAAQEIFARLAEGW
jgi:hypothetical protein